MHQYSLVLFLSMLSALKEWCRDEVLSYDRFSRLGDIFGVGFFVGVFLDVDQVRKLVLSCCSSSEFSLSVSISNMRATD